ncbi:MAG: sugar phosphate isomerase/epimerase [Candidatus Bathyarchaeia archaeon]
MKIGLNTNVYADYPLESFLDKIVRMGFEGIEIARMHAIHELPKAGVSEYKKLIKKATLEVYSVQGGTPFTNTEFAKKRIELARLLDCINVNMGPGIGMNINGDFSAAWKKTLESFTEIAEYANNYGINANIEPEPRAPLSFQKPTITTYEHAEKMLQELGMKNVGLVLDIIHTFVSKENIFKIITRCIDKIKVIHVGDTIDGRHLHLLPGRGNINFELILRALMKTVYKDYLSVEIYPYFDVPDEASFQSIIYLQGILQRIS